MPASSWAWKYPGWRATRATGIDCNEICALTDTLVLDDDGLYNPAHFNDRLLLGLKGTMSEAELHVMRARLRGGIINKARRGELEMRLPIGFVYDTDGHTTAVPNPRFPALALFGRRPSECVERPSSRRPKTCTQADSCTATKNIVIDQPNLVRDAMRKRADEFASLHSITVAYEHVWLTYTKRIRMPQGSLHF